MNVGDKNWCFIRMLRMKQVCIQADLCLDLTFPSVTLNDDGCLFAATKLHPDASNVCPDLKFLVSLVEGGQSCRTTLSPQKDIMSAVSLFAMNIKQSDRKLHSLSMRVLMQFVVLKSQKMYKTC